MRGKKRCTFGFFARGLLLTAGSAEAPDLTAGSDLTSEEEEEEDEEVEEVEEEKEEEEEEEKKEADGGEEREAEEEGRVGANTEGEAAVEAGVDVLACAAMSEILGV